MIAHSAYAWLSIRVKYVFIDENETNETRYVYCS